MKKMLAFALTIVTLVLPVAGQNQTPPPPGKIIIDTPFGPKVVDAPPGGAAGPPVAPPLAQPQIVPAQPPPDPAATPAAARPEPQAATPQAPEEAAPVSL